MKIGVKLAFAALTVSLVSPVFAAKKADKNAAPKTKAAAEKSAKSEDKSAGKDVSRAVYAKYASPSTGAQETWGTLNCHDPKIFQDDDGTYYVYSTDAAIGGAGAKGLQVRRSTDLVNWECLANPAIMKKQWDKKWLKWVEFDRAGASSWAPTVIKQNGLYYMYHGIITDKNASGDPVASICLAIANHPEGPFYPAQEAAGKDPEIASKLSAIGVEYKQSQLVRYTYYDRYWVSDDDDITEWECLNLGSWDTLNNEAGESTSMVGGFGCIDPEFVTDVATGKNMIYKVGGVDCYGVTYGSWKGGISLMYVDVKGLKPVDPDGNIMDAPADTVEGAFGKRIAGGFGAAYEGAQVIYNSANGWYYCFVSMGTLDWDYRVGVGRSKNPYGPYLDASGRNMLISPLSSEGEFHTIGSKIIGSEVLKDEYSFRSQGGQSILRTADGKIIMANHARTNFLPGYYFFLQIHQMFFTEEGWPLINGNEYYNDYDGKDEQLAALTVEEIAGTYDTILTERSEVRGDGKFMGTMDPIPNVYLTDGLPTKSKSIVLDAEGNITGDYTGKWVLADDGYTVKITLDGKGSFDGFALKSVDWARKKGMTRRTISFTTICSESNVEASGEYFWGNKR